MSVVCRCAIIGLLFAGGAPCACGRLHAKKGANDYPGDGVELFDSAAETFFRKQRILAEYHDSDDGTHLYDAYRPQRRLLVDDDDHGDDDHGDHDHQTSHHYSGDRLRTSHQWAAAIVTGLILTLNSCFGSFLLVLITGKRYSLLLQFTLVTLSIAVIVPDAFLHLFPHALEGAEGFEKIYYGISAVFGCVITGSFVMFGKGYHHLHPKTANPDNIAVMPKNSAEERPPTKESPDAPPAGSVCSTRDTSLKKIKPFGWAAIGGDVLCNFADGLTIGVAWFLGWRVGVTTAVAILLHEFPQELSDFAILRMAGMTRCEVVAVNAFTSLFSLLGIIIGLGFSLLFDSSIGHFVNASLAFTAGAWLSIGALLLVPIASDLAVQCTTPSNAEENIQFSKLNLLTVVAATATVGVTSIVAIELLSSAYGGHSH